MEPKQNQNTNHNEIPTTTTPYLECKVFYIDSKRQKIPSLFKAFSDKFQIEIMVQNNQKLRKEVQLNMNLRIQWKIEEQNNIPQIKGFKLVKKCDIQQTDMQYSTDLSKSLTNYTGQKVKILLEIEFLENFQINKLLEKVQTQIIQLDFHNHYKALKRIGKGSFACVYLVQNRIHNKKFAAKAFIKEKIDEDPLGYECLFNEIKIMQNLDHEHILKLHEVWESENSYYFILNLCQYGSLGDQISLAKKYVKNRNLANQQKRFDFSDIKNPQIQNIKQQEQSKLPSILLKSQIKVIMRQLISSLHYLDQKNIMHRDIKPDNIMFQSKHNTHCILADFGLATFQNEKEYLYPKCGTPGYVAPEVINLKGTKEEQKKQKYSVICDMFSLGSVFYYILTLKQLFPGQNTKETIFLNKECKLDFKKPELQNCDPMAIDLVKKMLEKNPKTRITPQEALDHPYLIIKDQGNFKQDLNNENLFEDENVKEDEQLHDINKQLRRINSKQINITRLFAQHKYWVCAHNTGSISDIQNYSPDSKTLWDNQSTHYNNQKSIYSYSTQYSQHSIKSIMPQQNSLVIKQYAMACFQNSRSFSIEDKLDHYEHSQSRLTAPKSNWKMQQAKTSPIQEQDETYNMSDANSNSIKQNNNHIEANNNLCVQNNGLNKNSIYRNKVIRYSTSPITDVFCETDFTQEEESSQFKKKDNGQKKNQNNITNQQQQCESNIEDLDDHQRSFFVQDIQDEESSKFNIQCMKISRFMSQK